MIKSTDSYIVALFNIDEEDINKNIRIIDTYDNYMKTRLWFKKLEELKNERQIMENVEIFVNDKKINFSYYHKFQDKGINIIKYIFKNKVTNICYLFNDLKNLISIDLSHFNAENITDMSYMFVNCECLTSIDLSNLNTENVTHLEYMFAYCISLTSLNLSNLNMKNAIDMTYMFSQCYSLTSLDLSNIKIQNVADVKDMFYQCRSLKKNNVITQDEKIINELNRL